MANLHVELAIRIRTSEGKRKYSKPFLSKNGKLKPQYALVNGRPEHHPEGTYYLRYGESGKRIWKLVGRDPDVAFAEKLKREQILRSRQLGLKIVEEGDDAARLKLQDAIANYLLRVRLTRSQKTQNEFDLIWQENFQLQSKRQRFRLLQRFHRIGNSPASCLGVRWLLTG